MKLRIGHPAEHLPHWKQRDTFDPERASTFLTNPRFIVSCERGILVCFIETPFSAPLLEEAGVAQGEDSGKAREFFLVLLNS